MMTMYLAVVLFISTLSFDKSAIAAEGKIHLSFQSASGSIPLVTWKDMRDRDLEKQDEDFSCGSAAVATILRSFYGIDVYERDILDEVIRLGDDGTASFHDLQQAVKKFGFRGVGISLSFAKLRTLKVPAVAYLKHQGLDHFSVIRGIGPDGTVWLGDPSWGNRTFSQHQFLEKWETREDETLTGKILLIIPEDEPNVELHHTFFRTPELNRTAIRLLTLRQ